MRRGVLSGLVFVSATIPTLAQSNADPVETVIVTARPPDPVGNDAFSVVTLDSGDLRVSNNLDKSLEQVPGLSLFRRDTSLSANPTTQGVSLRSIAPSGAGRALVTLDGVPQNDPFGGWVIWSALPPEDIANAEIVRGAGAGPYGAGALTGVIALTEQSGDGIAAADASYGSANTQRIGVSGGARSDRIAFFGSASYESSDGWIPVPPERGAADDAVTVVARNASVGVDASPDGATTFAFRGGVYDEHRDSGVVGTTSADSGETVSLTLAHPAERGALGWRLQTWVRDTNFSNNSASVATGRATATPSNNQYATPALGWGVNAALRGEASWLNWEIGTDLRSATGESREHFSFVSGHFTMNRVSGGRSFVGGGYAEGAVHLDDVWLITVGVRADQWATTGGHILQSVIATGAPILVQHFPTRSGVVPTARAGVRRDFGDFYLRSAAYEGFRAPSLNELYRPFRLGNNFTTANPALGPEELYGAEIGGGTTLGDLSVDATGFWNQLHAAITNVTIGHGPGTFPVAGFLPAGGLLIQRQNAGDIDAWGVEVDSHYRVTDKLHLSAAFDAVDATVHGGTQAPQLTGKQPAQAPRWTVTGSIDAEPLDRLTLYADIRYESNRFADDQNTLPLGDAMTVDARASWLLAPQWSVYVAADNIFNARVATTASTDSLGRIIFSDEAPAEIRAGLSFTR